MYRGTVGCRDVLYGCRTDGAACSALGFATSGELGPAVCQVFKQATEVGLM
jgi:hypothetical protein